MNWYLLVIEYSLFYCCFINIFNPDQSTACMLGNTNRILLKSFSSNEQEFHITCKHVNKYEDYRNANSSI